MTGMVTSAASVPVRAERQTIGPLNFCARVSPNQSGRRGAGVAPQPSDIPNVLRFRGDCG